MYREYVFWLYTQAQDHSTFLPFIWIYLRFGSRSSGRKVKVISQEQIFHIQPKAMVKNLFNSTKFEFNFPTIQIWCSAQYQTQYLKKCGFILKQMDRKWDENLLHLFTYDKNHSSVKFCVILMKMRCVDS